MLQLAMTQLTRDKWLSAAFDALAEGGIDALRVERLADRLGVTKGSFYHHFDDRRGLHLAMLDAWEQAGTSKVIEDVDSFSSSAGERLRRLAHRTMAVDPSSDAIENAIRAWAAVDEVAAGATARVDTRRLRYTEDLLVAIGLRRPVAKRRAAYFYRVLIGEFAWRSAGADPMSERDIDDLVDLLVAPASG
jgi:AcrR family transcriptional regulator